MDRIVRPAAPDADHAIGGGRSWTAPGPHGLKRSRRPGEASPEFPASRKPPSMNCFIPVISPVARRCHASQSHSRVHSAESNAAASARRTAAPVASTSTSKYPPPNPSTWITRDPVGVPPAVGPKTHARILTTGPAEASASARGNSWSAGTTAQARPYGGAAPRARRSRGRRPRSAVQPDGQGLELVGDVRHDVRRLAVRTIFGWRLSVSSIRVVSSGRARAVPQQKCPPPAPRAWCSGLRRTSNRSGSDPGPQSGHASRCSTPLW